MIKLYFDGIEVEKDYYRKLSQSYILFDKSFCLGSVPSNTFKIELNNKANISQFERVKIELDEKDYAYVYYDNLDNSNDNKSIISLSDAMMDFEFNYDASPLIQSSEKGYATILDILEDICSKVGVNLATKDFNLKDKQITWYDNTISARKYISFIATLNGGFARINRSGELELVSYTNSIKSEIDINTCLNYKIGEYHKITRVVWDIGVDKWEYGDDTGNTLYLDTENPFITVKEDVESIFNLINGFEFYSIKISKCPIDDKIDIGDTIAFRNGNKLYPFIAQKELDYNAGFRGGYNFIVNTEKIEETRVIDTEEKIKSIKSRLNRDEAKLEIISKETSEYEDRISSVEQTTNEIVQKVESKIDFTRNTSGIYKVTIEDAQEGPLIGLHITGNMELLYPSNELYPSDDLYPLGSYLIIENEEGAKQKIWLPITYLYNVENTSDEFVIERLYNEKTELFEQHMKIIRRIYVDNNGNKFIASNEKIEDLGLIEINLTKGKNTIWLESFYDIPLDFYVEYGIENEFSKEFATKGELKSSIEQTESSISLELEKKVDDETLTGANIMLRINEDESEAVIQADKIDLKGKEFDLTTDNISIKSKNFNVTKDGDITANNAKLSGEINSILGKIGGWNIEENKLWCEIKPPRDYSQTDLDRIQGYLLGNVSLSQAEISFYDCNGDGIVNSYELLYYQKMILYGIGVSHPGKLVLDTSDWFMPIKILNGSNVAVAWFGPDGAITREIE